MCEGVRQEEKEYPLYRHRNAGKRFSRNTRDIFKCQAISSFRIFTSINKSAIKFIHQDVIKR